MQLPDHNVMLLSSEDACSDVPVVLLLLLLLLHTSQV
jgi:hypothetical protein